VLDMSKTYRISEVAQRTGFTTPTIRYYEQIGVVPAPHRRESGYRVYDERGLDRLAFVSRAKQLGLTLDEVRELSAIWDQDECAPVQERMAAFVAARLAETQDRVADLIAFGAQLQSAAAQLAGTPHLGPCDEACACGPAQSPTTRKPVRLTREARAENPAVDVQPIACSLDAGEVDTRMDDWQALLGRVIARAPIDGGVSLSFAPDPAVAAEAGRLAVSEQACCAFFDFTVRASGGELHLDVRGPQQAQEVISAVFGVAGDG
jgi:DNA-binding transcriptional MerR regulator